MKEKLKDYSRVLAIAKRPNMEEYKQIVKLTGLGMVLIGMIGLLITLIFTLLGI